MSKSSTIFCRALALATGMFMLALPAAAQYYGQSGQSSASLSLASSKQFDRDYTVISGRYGKFFVDNFEASLGLELWRGNSPEIYKVVPELRYVSPTGQTFKPYAALFLARTFYSNTVSSHNSFGVRGGMYYAIDRNSYFGLGLVGERVESCDRSALRDCDYVYPEITLHFRF